MKFLIGTLLLPFVILSNFGELNAASNAGEGSGSPGSSSRPRKKTGGHMPGGGRKKVPELVQAAVQLPARPHNATIEYMDREIYIWLKADGTLEQAGFPGMNVDTKELQTVYGLLVGVDVLLGRETVIYVLKNGTLMSVRAPKIPAGDEVEPSLTKWFVFDSRTQWRLHVQPVQILVPDDYPYPVYHYEPVSIELLRAGNKRRIQPYYVKTLMDYPLGMKFCTYSLLNSKGYALLMGGFFPKPGTIVNNVELIC